MAHQARKRFGQNFLQDKNVIANIIAAINPQPAQHIVEIGPGMGALTKQLLPKVTSLDAIEIDRDLIAMLYTWQEPKLTIHASDVLKFDFASLAKSPLRIIGNLPYNISTPLLFHLLNYANLIQDMYFMLQQEVVERICAPITSSEYGRLSIMLQYHCQAASLFHVPNTAFKPQPKVESAIIRLIPYQQKPHQAKDEVLFATIVKTAFMHRRKTLSNNLKGFVSPAELATLEINPSIRPQELSIAQYVAITNFLA